MLNLIKYYTISYTISDKVEKKRSVQHITYGDIVYFMQKSSFCYYGGITPNLHKNKIISKFL